MREKHNISPILDEDEFLLLEELSKSYEDYMTPGKIKSSIDNAKDKVAKYVPQHMKNLSDDVKSTLYDQNVIKNTIVAAGKGFNVLEERAASSTLKKESIVKKLKKIDPAIHSFEDICCTRSYNIRKLVYKNRLYEDFSALTQGVVTGIPGVFGIPFNIVTSLFFYYRSVQNVALHYGFDIKEDYDELRFASQTLMLALSKSVDGTNLISTQISKMMVQTKLTVLKTGLNKSYTKMAREGGIQLLYVQIRALANKNARSALQKAKIKGMEKTIFSDMLEQLAKKMAKKPGQKSIPWIGALLGGLTDLYTMDQVVKFSELVYHKR